jgi:hypothetical protein
MQTDVDRGELKMLVLFGDSFISESVKANPGNHPESDNIEDICDHPTWFEMLSGDLGTEYKTYGRPGSSFEYSSLKFFEYLTSADYDPNDQIVFVLTSGERSPVIAKDFNPEWAGWAFYKVYPELLDSKGRQLTSKLTASDEHYTKYKQFYRDWILLKNQDLIVAQRYFLLQTLHSLPNKTVSISVGKEESSIEKFFPIHGKFCLGRISVDEFSTGDIWEIVTKNAGRHDRRLNHLDKKNHDVLKDAVYAGLTGGNFSDFNAKSFHKNLFLLDR